MQSAILAGEAAERQDLYGQAAKYYTEAADTYLEDDENHVYFLKIALEAHWWRGDPVKITLPLCTRIRSAIPEMMKIWELAPLLVLCNGSSSMCRPTKMNAGNNSRKAR
jgi:hypothetical protein